MKTVLDTAARWWIDSITYSENLVVELVPGYLGQKDDIEVARHVFKDTTPIGPDESSRLVIRFGGLIAWQVVDESYTAFVDWEVRDDTSSFQVLADSAYLRYVDEQFGLYKELGREVKHYRLISCDEVLDVVAFEAPEIGELTPHLVPEANS